MNTTEKIVVKDGKTLKLNNVLLREVSQNELVDFNQIVYMMDSYIKSKGNSVVGPMINYSSAKGDEVGNVKVTVKIMMQLKNPIHDIEKPYEFISQIRVTDCLFARFAEKEENIQYAYSKLTLHAFENNMKLRGDSYTVFVSQKEDMLMADIFMQKLKGGQEIEVL
jgi:hypothetical protein